ncbi:hypothetical protein H7Y29_00700 [Microbacteriaceae bacterium]|nr:hypothetical protein [Candidatus Saccharibacteria bacterium]
MIFEHESQIYDDICKDLASQPDFQHIISKLGYIARAQADGRLELLLRGFINQEGDAATDACEQLAAYTDAMMRRIQGVIPSFDTDDMQIVLSGVRTRIEGAIYE